MEDVKAATAKELTIILHELQSESDRGLPLVAGAILDDKLARTLRAFFIDHASSEKLLFDGDALLSSFSSRVSLCFALGLIDEHEHSELSIIRKVRNRFAHKLHGLTFEEPQIKGLCASLNSSIPNDIERQVLTPRFRFIHSVSSLLMKLYFRPEWTALNRVSQRPKEDPVKWLEVDQNTPPIGEPLMTIQRNFRGDIRIGIAIYRGTQPPSGKEG